ncbi:MAG: TolC family protein [Acidobacteriota bacterium]|nr:TolC family protein [Blastocatellia bacterium]MDW8413488.1 TolC family protein [Acidobacteriota bacterium]
MLRHILTFFLLTSISLAQHLARPSTDDLPVNLPTERIGIDSSKQLKLSLRDAIAMALERNLDIQIERDNVRIAEHNLLAAQGAYDISTRFTYNLADNTFPSASVLNRSGDSLKIKSNLQDFNFALSQLFPIGSQLNVEFNNRRQLTNNAFQLLNPQYTPNLNIQLVQPLLRNFKQNQAERSILSLKKQLGISDHAFRQRLIDLVARVSNAYYDLVFAIENAQIQRDSVELAAIQLRNNRIQVKAGTAAPIEIVSAEAELERRKDAAISALLVITQAENALKSLLLDDPASEYWSYVIVPTDKIEFVLEPIDLTSAMNVAIERRPELRQLDLRTEINKIDVEFFKNQAKPQIDLLFGFSAVGIAGRQTQKFIVDPGGAIIPVPTTFDGGYFKALGNMFDSRSYNFGLTFSFPLRNRTAKANLSRAILEARQLEARKRQAIEAVLVEVRNALQALETARQRVEAAQAAVRAAETQLKAEEQKFAVGLSTNFFVLQRQNDLAAARGNELRARTDYNKARADLQRVMANNIP